MSENKLTPAEEGELGATEEFLVSAQMYQILEMLLEVKLSDDRIFNSCIDILNCGGIVYNKKCRITVREDKVTASLSQAFNRYGEGFEIVIPISKLDYVTVNYLVEKICKEFIIIITKEQMLKYMIAQMSK